MSLPRSGITPHLLERGITKANPPSFGDIFATTGHFHLPHRGNLTHWGMVAANIAALPDLQSKALGALARVSYQRGQTA
jgi:hypothetical protein